MKVFSASWLMKSCSDPFENWQGYYSYTENLSWGWDGAIGSVNWGMGGALPQMVVGWAWGLALIISEVRGACVLFLCFFEFIWSFITHYTRWTQSLLLLLGWVRRVCVCGGGGGGGGGVCVCVCVCVWGGGGGGGGGRVRALSLTYLLFCTIYWFRRPRVFQRLAWSAPSHYLNKCWNIVNWTPRNKLQWIINRNSYIFVQENAFENVVWKWRPFCPASMC